MHLNNKVNEQTLTEIPTNRGLTPYCITSYIFQFQLTQKLKKSNCQTFYRCHPGKYVPQINCSFFISNPLIHQVNDKRKSG